jgi:hypothetical protein
VAGALLAPGPDGIRFLPVGEEMADYWLVWTFRLSRFIVRGPVIERETDRTAARGQ